MNNKNNQEDVKLTNLQLDDEKIYEDKPVYEIIVVEAPIDLLLTKNNDSTIKNLCLATFLIFALLFVFFFIIFYCSDKLELITSNNVTEILNSTLSTNSTPRN